MSVNEMMTLAGALAAKAGKGLTGWSGKHADAAGHFADAQSKIITAAIAHHTAVSTRQMDHDHAERMFDKGEVAKVAEDARQRSNKKLDASIRGAEDKQKFKQDRFMHALDTRRGEAEGNRLINRDTASNLMKQNNFNDLFSRAEPGTAVRVGDLSATKPSGGSGAEVGSEPTSPTRSSNSSTAPGKPKSLVAPAAVRKQQALHIIKHEGKMGPAKKAQHMSTLVQMHGGNKVLAQKFLDQVRKEHGGTASSAPVPNEIKSSNPPGAQYE